jgi:hypothetical protein
MLWEESIRRKGLRLLTGFGLKRKVYKARAMSSKGSMRRGQWNRADIRRYPLGRVWRLSRPEIRDTRTC